MFRVIKLNVETRHLRKVPFFFERPRPDESTQDMTPQDITLKFSDFEISENIRVFFTTMYGEQVSAYPRAIEALSDFVTKIDLLKKEKNTAITADCIYGYLNFQERMNYKLNFPTYIPWREPPDVDQFNKDTLNINQISLVYEMVQ